MDAEIFQLDRCNGCRGVRQHKAELLRQACRRHLYNVRAIQHGHNAAGAHLCADLGMVKLNGLLEQRIGCRGDDQRALSLGHFRIVQRLRRGQTSGIDVGLGERCGCGLVACAGGHHGIHVGVNLGYNHFTQFARQRGAGFQLLLRFVLIQPVNVEDERAVMLQQQFLGGCGQVKQLAITGQGFAGVLGGSAAVAAVVVQGRGADLIQLDSGGTCPIIIGIGQQSDLAFSFKQVVSLRCKFGGKFNGHILNLV